MMLAIFIENANRGLWLGRSHKSRDPNQPATRGTEDSSACVASKVTDTLPSGNVAPLASLGECEWVPPQRIKVCRQLRCEMS